MNIKINFTGYPVRNQISEEKYFDSFRHLERTFAVRGSKCSLSWQPSSPGITRKKQLAMRALAAPSVSLTHVHYVQSEEVQPSVETRRV